jgi:hypothetical protein
MMADHVLLKKIYFGLEIDSLKLPTLNPRVKVLETTHITDSFVNRWGF